MKKIVTFVKDNRMSLLSFALLGLAIIFGADTSVAMADAVADTSGLNTDLSGEAATAGQKVDAGFTLPEVDGEIAKYNPFMFGLDTDMRTMVKVFKASGYEVEHYRAGASVLDCNLLVTKQGGTSVRYLTLTFGTDVPQAAERILNIGATITVPVSGYDTDGTTEKGYLMFYVTEKTSTSATIVPLNGLKDSSGNMYVPDLIAGIKLSVCAYAGSESQLVVAPDNFQPQGKVVYLQKKILNMVFTNDFINAKGRAPFDEKELREFAVYNFRRKSSRSLWIGTQSKVRRNVGINNGEEYVYTQEGVLPQITNKMNIARDTAGKLSLDYSDLIAMCKLQFTVNSVSNIAYAYAGRDFLEALMNIDFTKHHDIEVKQAIEAGINIKSFTTNFGTMIFKHEDTLDDLGFSECCAILDMKNAVRYYKVEENKQSDMSQGSGEVRDAKREVYICTDCLCLKGYNSLWVAPANTGVKYGSVTVYKVSALPTVSTDAVNGGIYYLTTAQTISGTTYSAGNLYVASVSGSTVTYTEYSA